MSFEPNYKRCAVQLHSVKVPNGIKFVEEEIAGELEHVVVKKERNLSTLKQTTLSK